MCGFPLSSGDFKKSKTFFNTFMDELKKVLK